MTAAPQSVERYAGVDRCLHASSGERTNVFRLHAFGDRVCQLKRPPKGPLQDMQQSKIQLLSQTESIEHTRKVLRQRYRTNLVCDMETDIVIEGYPRSANSFTVNMPVGLQKACPTLCGYRTAPMTFSTSLSGCEPKKTGADFGAPPGRSIVVLSDLSRADHRVNGTEVF